EEDVSNNLYGSEKRRQQKPRRVKPPTAPPNTPPAPSPPSNPPITEVEFEEVELHKRRKSYSGERRKKVEKDTKYGQKRMKAAYRIETPYVELNLVENCVELVIPKQKLKKGVPILKSREFKLNEDTMPLEVDSNEDGEYIQKEAKRYKIDNQLIGFEIPQYLKRFSYIHQDQVIYFFRRSRNIYKLEYSTDLSNGDYIILLDPDWEILTSVKEDYNKWFWGKYEPFKIHLSKDSGLLIRHKEKGDKKTFKGITYFKILSENKIGDKFLDSSPLFFSKKPIRIRSETKLAENLLVWIQPSQFSGQKKKIEWKPFKGNLLIRPEDLPAPLGEFQVDIWEEGESFSIDRLYFRYIPFIRIEYPRKLIIPNWKEGYDVMEVKISVQESFYVEADFHVEREHSASYSSYTIKVPPKNVSLDLNIKKRDFSSQELAIRIELSKIRWKLLGQSQWQSKILVLNSEDIKSGVINDLEVQITDEDSEYRVQAFLKNDQNSVQEDNLRKRKNKNEYTLHLTQFADTIARFSSDMSLELVISTKEKKYSKEMNRLPVIIFRRFYRNGISVPPAVQEVKYESIPVYALYKLLNIIKGLVRTTHPDSIPKIESILANCDIPCAPLLKDENLNTINEKLFVLEGLRFLQEFLPENKWLNFDGDLYDSIMTIIFCFKNKYPSEFQESDENAVRSA
ncbi:MAG: hypothetical protein ACTSQI_17995, partial [Candidatus Helarchaeota archaeon]